MNTEHRPQDSPLLGSDVRAIQFALEELEAYVSAVGTADDAHERHLWTIRKLKELLHKVGAEPINV